MLHKVQFMETSDALTDPVCGMSVTTDSRFHVQHNHQDYYFCCQGCADKFSASPAKYLNPEDSSHHVGVAGKGEDRCEWFAG